MSGTTYFNSQSLDGIKDATLSGNLYANNIIMSSNMSTNSGQGNVYFSGNLVVNGNIFSLGGSVGSGSGTSQGVTFTLASSYSLTSAGGTQPFANGVAGPNISGFNINLNQFAPQAVQAVTSFSASTGMLKFATGGLYQVQCVLVGDQPVAKVGIGSTTSSTFPPTASPTGNYVYVYNFPLNSSPSEVVTIPLTITDTSKWYYLDAYFSNIAGTPTVLYQTAPPSGSAAGTNYGTYVQVSPFGNYLTSATGVASGLLLNCSSTTTLSAPLSSNTFRLAMTSSNGWTVNGVSTSLAVTSGGNFQVSQVGIYEVSMCLNTSVTPMMFGVGSLATDTAPGTQGPYLYQYAPMYTQDPTTVLSLPLNITDTSKYYYIDVIFPGTQATVALSNVSTYVALRPVGSYVSPSTNPWSQQGTSVTYSGGAVGIGGVNPSALTETFTVNGNTSFVGNVTVTSDASGNAYVLADRVPTGSLHVSSYVTGSVPLTTTTNLIRNYLSNAASITSNTGTGYQALYCPGSVGSGVNFGTATSTSLSNLALSNLWIEAWYNPGPIPAINTAIVQKYDGLTAADFTFNITSTTGVPFFLVSNATASIIASNATGLVSGTWYHMAASWQRTGVNTGTVRIFTNGGLGGTTASFTTGSNIRYTPTANVAVGSGSTFTTAGLSGNVLDVRIMTNCIIPTATFTAPSTPAPFTTAPTYVAGMSTGYSSNLTLALNSQYFPGASTSPYGPCLTLPGTVGSYYSQSVGTHSDWKGTGGFTFETWVNYASFANANTTGTPTTTSFPYSFNVSQTPNFTGVNWVFGPNILGQVAFCWLTSGGATNNAFVTSNTLTTGSWNHILVQSNGSNVYMAINGNFTTLTAQGFTPTNGAGTIAPSIAPSTSYNGNFTSPLNIGQYYVFQGPNFAVAKARLIYGANVYSSGSFTPSPNFASSAVAPFWSLDSQYPLPTYPSIQDVTVVPSQLTSYGSIPTPVGGVTSNVLGPFSTTYPQLDSIRFDGTGYIDYGNAASSALCSNLWASPWTIEAWVYLTALPGGALYPPIFARQQIGGGADWAFQINPSGTLFFQTAAQQISGPTLALGTWYHVAATYDGARCNVYTSYNSSSVGSVTVTGADMAYTPSRNFLIAAYPSPTSYYITGNLADVRVSNVARYTGSSYTVPSAPFTTDSNTLLLLKSLAGQVGTTLEIQGRGLNSTSLGATRTVQSYPPAPMSSYLLDTTSNASVTYGQGKYVASASSEGGTQPAWNLFDKSGSVFFFGYSYSAAGVATGAVSTSDTLGNVYAGDWVQIQLPVSVTLSSYYMQTNGAGTYSPKSWYILGSRDGINWTLVHQVVGQGQNYNTTFTVSATQSYNYYRMVVNATNGSGNPAFYEWTLNGTEESLCITSDSKVGVGIANPQRALEVAGDLVVSGTISGGAGMGSFRNRIINGDMRIAQRGTSNVLSLGSDIKNYMIDRFFAQSYFTTAAAMTQYQSALAASDAPYQLGLRNYMNVVVNIGLSVTALLPISQVFEGYNIQDFNWGTSFGSPVTLSFWFRSNAPVGSQFTYSLINYAGTANYAGTFVPTPGIWQYWTFTIPPPQNGTAWNTGANGALALYIASYYPGGFTTTVNQWNSGSYTYCAYGSYNWPGLAGNFLHCTGVQLEKGTVATPFEFRPYAQELALCQRYYYQWNSTLAYGVLGYVTATNASNGLLAVPFPVQMRAAVSSTGNFSSSAVSAFSTQGPSWGTLSAIASVNDGNSLNMGQIVLTFSAATAGQTIQIRANGSTTAYVAWSAEL